VALRLTGLTNLLYEVAKRLRTTSSLWPVYSKGLPLELTAERAWLIHTISLRSVGRDHRGLDDATRSARSE